MNRWFLPLLALIAGAVWLWYRRETVLEGDGVVHLQSEHEHFHLHVDLPPGMEIEPGDTLEILTVSQNPWSDEWRDHLPKPGAIDQGEQPAA
jgi:hypothetical protein